ncbi:MAG: hypothetical protein LW700_14225 [Gemmataceae bacterium]|nr:hypothetical protein [Gemmataceae bacterium]
MMGKGCSNCNNKGYRGRRGIFEMMRMNGPLREMTFRREPTQAIRRVALASGMTNLLSDGISKALRGLTTLDEVLSTCHHDPSHDAPPPEQPKKDAKEPAKAGK